MGLTHFLKSVCQGFADLLHFTLLLLGEDKISFTGDGTLENLLADQLADQSSNCSLLQFELECKSSN
jgi:hypothetical protein